MTDRITRTSRIAELAETRSTIPLNDPAKASRGDTLAATPRTAPAAGAPSTLPPRLGTTSLAHRLGQADADAGAGDGARYEVRARLGTGATAVVWELFDRSLERPLAAKVLDPAGGGDLAAFIEEARITAALEHPNVLPVHDIDLAADGRAFFTMKRIEGRSFGAVLADSTPPARHELARDANAVVAIVLGVANALAYAHHRGVVHQDVKPDNIMLGGFGEVLLVDWGSAQRLADRPMKLFGTPLYMSPEQARNDCADVRSDVYCLGATLFHALTLRLPTLAEDLDTFWRKKRAGEIDPPTPEERRRLPAPLLAIALKAMAAEPAARYQSMEALIADLKAYQAGLAVSAQREPWWRRMWRWCRRHARAVAIAAPTASTAVLLALVVWGDDLKAMATWGQPVVHEEFDDPSLARWTAIGGAFAARDHQLVSVEAEDILALRRRFDGDVRIEYDCRCDPAAPLGDMSAIWSPAVDPSKHDYDAIALDQSLQFEFGAWGGAVTMIEAGHHQVFGALPLERGRTYHVRIELRDHIATLAIDGREVCRYLAPLPIGGGYLLLYAYHPGKSYAHLRVWVRDVPQLVPATEVGDWLLRSGQDERAAAEYARVADSHPDTDLARTAIYREGLAHWHAHDRPAAEEAWRLLDGTVWAREAALVRLESAIQDHQDEAVVAALERLATTTPELIPRLGDLWCTAMEDVRNRSWTAPNRRAMEAYLHLRERWFASRPSTGLVAARGLVFIGRYQEVIDRFRGFRFERCAALLRSGRARELVAEFGDDPDLQEEVFEARMEMGDIDPDHAPAGAKQAKMLCLAGRGDEAFARYPEDDEGCLLSGHGDLVIAKGVPRSWWKWSLAMIATGRAHDVPDDLTAKSVPVLMVEGRLDEAMAVADGAATTVWWTWSRMLPGLRAWIAGDRARAEGFFQVPPEREFYQDRAEPGRTVIVPFLRELGGDRAAVDRACADAVARRRWTDGQRSWHLARYLSGEIDDQAFLAQPVKLGARALLLVARAVRAERVGHPAEAIADYRAWLDIPAWQRGGLDPVAGEFVAWRLRELGK